MKKLFDLFIILVILSCSHLKDAHQFYNNGDYKAAINECKTAIQSDSTDAEAYFLLGQSYNAIGDLDGAESALATAVELEPESEAFRSELQKVVIAKGKQKFDSGEYYRAIEEYERALELCPKDAQIIEKIGDAFFQAGKHDRAHGDFKRCLAFGGDSSSVNPKLAKIENYRQHAEEIYSKGGVELDKKRYDKAKILFSETLKIKPDFLDAKYSLHIATGLRLLKKGSKSALWDAVMEFGYAAALRSNSAEPHYLMARAYEKKDRNEFDNAIREYELAAEIEPNSELGKKSVKKAKELRARKKKLKDFWGR